MVKYIIVTKVLHKTATITEHNNEWSVQFFSNSSKYLTKITSCSPTYLKLTN